jgi:long-chain acyl-CoA synthetase
MCATPSVATEEASVGDAAAQIAGGTAGDEPVRPDLGSLLPRAAARHGPRTALVTSAMSLTYRELDELTERAASGLSALGVRPGDRVSLYSLNRWEWVVAYHAALRVRAVVNPINVMLTKEEVAFVLADCAAVAIFTSGDKAGALAGMTRDIPSLRSVISFDQAGGGVTSFAELLASTEGQLVARAPTPAADDVAIIGYTSGTTGHPKGAMQTHQAVYLNTAAVAATQARTERDVTINALPLPHVYGSVIMNGVLMTGATLVMHERFDPARMLAGIQDHRATCFDGVPTMFMMMLADPSMAGADLSSLRVCSVGGQTMPAAKMAEWERRSGVPLLELWGMTEIAGAGIANVMYQPNVHGSIGFPLPGLEARVASTADCRVTVPDGEPGELMVRGPFVMPGYFGNEAATRNALEPDGWLHTGDVAVRDAQGRFSIVDRLKDMILTAGFNVYPAEIERIVAGHPAVAMVAVGAVADDVRGELARAYVVLRPGQAPTELEIIEYCRPHLAAYKLPRSVAFVPDLPKTSTGKVLRRELKNLDV